MFVKKLYIKNYRNLEESTVEFSENVNIIMGDNAQGKTNLLESIFVASIGRSFRNNLDKQLISFDEEFAYVSAHVLDTDYYDKIEFFIDKNSKKKISINGLPLKKNGDLLGNFITVSFTPFDLNLIKDSPNDRRRFLDMEISQMSQLYFYDLKQYSYVLKNRNNLLKKIKTNKSKSDEIFVWDTQLVQYATKIYNTRQKFITKISEIANDIHQKITNGEETLELVYKNNITPETLEAKLQKNLERDILLGTTSSGIHKDDLVFNINGLDAKFYGSQGQQRTAILSVKLAEIYFIKATKNKVPVILLDDVLSELDKNRQKQLIEQLGDMQIILTCTGVEDFVNYFKDASIFKIDKGVIKQVNN